MVRLFCLACGLILGTQSCWAITTGFEDLPAGHTYNIGDSFTSGGLGFDVVAFPATSTTISIDSLTKAKGQGQEVGFSRSVGLAFQLSSAVQEVSFLFGDYFTTSSGPGTGGVLRINGVTSLPSGFLALDGTSLGGVQVAVKPVSVPDGVTGKVTLTGPIQSLTVGSTSVYIDDVSVVVPEPSTVMLAMVGFGSVGAWQRKRS